MWLTGDAAARAATVMAGLWSREGLVRRLRPLQIDDLLHGIAPVGPGFAVDRAVVTAMPDRLPRPSAPSIRPGGCTPPGCSTPRVRWCRWPKTWGGQRGGQGDGAELLQGRLPLSDRCCS